MALIRGEQEMILPTPIKAVVPKIADRPGSKGLSSAHVRQRDPHTRLRKALPEFIDQLRRFSFIRFCLTRTPKRLRPCCHCVFWLSRMCNRTRLPMLLHSFCLQRQFLKGCRAKIYFFEQSLASSGVGVLSPAISGIRLTRNLVMIELTSLTLSLRQRCCPRAIEIS